MKRSQDFRGSRRFKLWQLGLTDEEIAERVGTTKDAIRAWRHRHGLLRQVARGAFVKVRKLDYGHVLVWIPPGIARFFNFGVGVPFKARVERAGDGRLRLVIEPANYNGKKRREHARAS